MKHLPHASMFLLDEKEASAAVFMQENIKEGNAATRIWMITFADLVSLLLTFFIMLYAMSSINMENWHKVANNAELNRPESAIGSEGVVPARYALAELLYRRAVDLHYLQAVLEEAIKGDAALQGARIQLHEDRLVVSLPADYLFASAQARVAPQGEKVLFSLGGVLRNISNKINIVGYSSPSKAQQDGAEGWKLSLSRASVVADSLKRSGYARDIGIVGTVGAADTVAEAERRLTIVILQHLAEG